MCKLRCGSRIGFMFMLVAVQLCYLSQVLAADQPWKKHIVQSNKGVRSGINSAVTGDFNRDGKLDIIMTFDGQVVVYPGPDYTRKFVVHRFSKDGKRINGSCIHSTVMDVDGDGDSDLIGSKNAVFWLETPNKDALSKQWVRREVDTQIQGTHCLITGDVDRDGKLDLIANSGQTAARTTVPESVTWLKIPNKPHTAKHWIRNVFADRDAPGASHYMGFGDVNGDGLPDISCAAKGGERFPGGEWFAWWQQPKDPTKPWKKHLLAEKEVGATNIHPVDVNGDGQMDFIATRGHGQGVLWFKGKSPASKGGVPIFELIDIDKGIAGPHCLVTIDMDADGDTDFVTCGKEVDGIAAWYENDGKGKFTKHVIGKDQGSYDIRAVDLDGDKDLDILIAGHGSRNVVWYENPSK